MDEPIVITIQEFNKILKVLSKTSYKDPKIIEYRIRRASSISNDKYDYSTIEKEEITLKFLSESIERRSIESLIRILLIELERNNIKINDDSIFNC